MPPRSPVPGRAARREPAVGAGERWREPAGGMTFPGERPRREPAGGERPGVSLASGGVSRPVGWRSRMTPWG
jgi:hypothetical protein